MIPPSAVRGWVMLFMLHHVVPTADALAQNHNLKDVVEVAILRALLGSGQRVRYQRGRDEARA